MLSLEVWTTHLPLHVGISYPIHGGARHAEGKGGRLVGKMEEQEWLEHPHILGDHPLGITSSGKIKATSYLLGRGGGSEDTSR